MALDKEGLYEMSMDLDLSDLGEPTAMGLDLSGTVFCQEETVSRSFPTIEISFESYGERFQIGFSVESTVSPLTAPCTFDHTATSLFSLSTDELQEEFLKYKSGAKSALMKAMMMMYQANPGLFTA